MRRKRMWWRREPKSLGRRGEDAAARFLKKQGFRILERNRFLGRYEIDIIAREGDTIAFVEVRTRKVLDEVPPEDTVGPRKQHHIQQAAQYYIDQNEDPNIFFRFDIVSVIMPDTGKPTITLFRNAFGG